MGAVLKKGLWATILLSVSVILVWLLLPAPSLKPYKGESTAFYDRNGKLLRLTLASDERYRIYTPLEEVAPLVQRATLLYEDQYFYQHTGINFVALWRAFWQTYIAKSRRIGASTITMQVARLQFDLESKTVLGKLQQIIYALQLERHYSKKEILEAYFNLAPYGGNIEGIAAASQIYFNKLALELTLPEVLLLAVIPQNPSKRNPQFKSGYKENTEARKRLFARWLKEYPEYKHKAHIIDMPLAIFKTKDLPFNAPHFVTNLKLNNPFLTGRVNTTLDLEHQYLIEGWLTRHIQNHRQKGMNNGAVLLLNYQTMEVEAWVGSADFYDDSLFGQVDGVVAKRSPGSALKPFIYGMALEQGLIHPQTLLKDSPLRFGAYTPENFDKKFLGPVLATDALITSRNVPAVNLQSQLKEPSFYQFLRRANIRGLKKESHYGLSLSLGGMEVTMQEMVELYAMLANGGVLKKIKKTSLDVIPKENSNEIKLLSPEAAYLTLDMLSHNSAPGEIRVPSLISKKKKIAWKTGTSFAFRDAWAVGVAGPYVLAVWIGNFDGEGNPSFVGRTASGPLFFNIFRELSTKLNWPENWLEGKTSKHLNITQVDVCAPTGDLPGKYCPQTTTSWFIPGVSPIKVSNVHRAIPIDNKTGKRKCWYDPGVSRLEVYEFWPSDLEAIFRKAGVARRPVPKLDEPCSLEELAIHAMEPNIQSPVNNVIYSLRSHRLKEEKIPFKATLDASVKKVHWFVDNAYIGSNPANDVRLWPPRAGRYIVKAVDENGLSDEVAITVKIVSTE